MKQKLLSILFFCSVLILKADPFMPVISDDENTVWYCIQFSHKGELTTGNVIQEMGNEQGLRYYQPLGEHANYRGYPNYSQLWKIIEIEEGLYKLVAKSGRVLASDGTNTGIATINENIGGKTYYTFRLLQSTHSVYNIDSWTLQENTNTAWFLNQSNGPTGTNVTIQKSGTTAAQNNSLRFINPADLGFSEDGDWKEPEYVDLYSSIKMPVISNETNVKWYCIQYVNTVAGNDSLRRVVEEQGVNNEIFANKPSVEHEDYPGKINYAQLWKVVGDEINGYSLVAKSGRVLAVGQFINSQYRLNTINSGIPEESYITFNFNASTNDSYKWSWALSSTGIADEYTRYLNLAGGPAGTGTKNLALYNGGGTGGENNMINFVNPVTLGFPADGNWVDNEYQDLFAGTTTTVKIYNQNDFKTSVKDKLLTVIGDNILNVNIYNITGKKIISKNNQFEFMLPDAGCYLVNVLHLDGSSATRKVIMK